MENLNIREIKKRIKEIEDQLDLLFQKDVPSPEDGAISVDLQEELDYLRNLLEKYTK